MGNGTSSLMHLGQRTKEQKTAERLNLTSCYYHLIRHRCIPLHCLKRQRYDDVGDGADDDYYFYDYMIIQ